jgi:hypothetical protein
MEGAAMILAEEYLREIEAAEQAATAGEWLFTHLAGEDCRHLVANHNHQSVTRIADRLLRDLFRPEDACFIAGARVWVPQLLAMVRQLQKDNQLLYDGEHWREQRILELQQELDALEAT